MAHHLNFAWDGFVWALWFADTARVDGRQLTKVSQLTENRHVKNIFVQVVYIDVDD